MNFDSPLLYFTDAVLRAPTIGCMLMCFAAALVGVIVFLRKQSLLGESLSHAAYPGVILGVIFAGLLAIDDSQELAIAILIMIGAFFSAMTGLWAINFLERRLSVRSDSALCFILSVFFGIGLTLASQVQFAYSSLYRQVQVYLYGQAATMTDVHIVIYGILSLVVLAVVLMMYKEIQSIAFDRDYARSLGINTKMVDAIVFVLIVLAVVIGIRSVGVVLMSAMLIAPAAAARQYTNKLSIMFAFAAFFGVISGFLGNYLSVEITRMLAIKYPLARLALPTGPMIVIVASCICLLSLMFAPERGLLIRLARIARFKYQCMCENLLKAIWRFDKAAIGLISSTDALKKVTRASPPWLVDDIKPIADKAGVTFEEIAKYQSASTWYLRFVLRSLTKQGWIEHAPEDRYSLTVEGMKRAERIVRFHRLWEVYLVDYLGIGAERVHRSAEEMEHIITPDLERELTRLLQDPKQDPHKQPIPGRYS